MCNEFVIRERQNGITKIILRNSGCIFRVGLFTILSRWCCTALPVIRWTVVATEESKGATLCLRSLCVLCLCETLISRNGVEWALFVFCLWRRCRCWSWNIVRSWLGRWSQWIDGIARRIRKIKEGRTTSKVVLSMELMCCFRLYLRCICISGFMNLLHSCIELIVNRIIRNGVVSRSILSPLFFCCCIYSLCNILERCSLACASSVISNVAYFAILRKNAQ